MEASELLSIRIQLYAGNTIEQRGMDEAAILKSGWKCADVLVIGYEARARDTCEQLFRMGFYGPCCVMARALVEYMLQNDVIDHAAGNPELTCLKIQIEKIGKRNPCIDEMFDALKDAGFWAAEDRADVMAIGSNGDAVVHHRYDKTSKGVKPLVTAFGPMTGLTERETAELNRDPAERRLAKNSLMHLYDLVIRRRSV